MQEIAAVDYPGAGAKRGYFLRDDQNWIKGLTYGLTGVNKELWLALSLLALAGLLNYLATSQRMVLGFYALPTLYSAYFYGRRHAILTALASMLLVGLLVHYNPTLLTEVQKGQLIEAHWHEITAWVGVLIVASYAMGALHEQHENRVWELSQTYHGLLLILRQFISKDKYTENHPYRVSIYGVKIAAHMRLSAKRIEDIRAASLLHDIGKLGISRKRLYKAARLTQNEYEKMKRHAGKGAEMLESTGGPLSRIIPIIFAHHDAFNGSGCRPVGGEQIPLEAQVIAVADVYDSLTSDRPYRKAISPFAAKQTIVNRSGTDFDPRVVNAFVTAFDKEDLEIPEVVL